MKKYICNNQECGNVWESMEEPFECPKCHGADITCADKEPSFVSLLKKWWWAAAAVVALVLLVVLFVPHGGTRVSVKADTEMHTLSVELSGDGAAEYAVVLKRNGVILTQSNPTSDATTTHTFNDLFGEIELEIVWMGSGNAPRIGKYDRFFDFGEEPTGDPSTDEGSRVKVEIETLTSSPNLIAKAGDTYSVQVILSKSSTADVEYSMGNDKWVDNNVFTNLKPGTYIFYARNKKEHSYFDKMEFTLKPAAPKITVEQLNLLLRKVKDMDDDAFDAISKYNSIPVIGVEKISTVSELVAAFNNQSAKYTVVSIQYNDNGGIKSITVK